MSLLRMPMGLVIVFSSSLFGASDWRQTMLEYSGVASDTPSILRFIYEVKNVLYDMSITCSRFDDQCKFMIMIRNPQENSQCFTEELVLTADQVGVLNKICLERSGGPGGFGLFGAFSITSDFGSTPTEFSK